MKLSRELFYTNYNLLYVLYHVQHILVRHYPQFKSHIARGTILYNTALGA